MEMILSVALKTRPVAKSYRALKKSRRRFLRRNFSRSSASRETTPDVLRASQRLSVKIDMVCVRYRPRRPRACPSGT